MKGLFIFLFIFFVLPPDVHSLTINGKLENTSGYRYKVSLFHLRSIEEFNSVSNINLLEVAFTDNNGNFLLQSGYLPQEETIYRLNIRRIRNEEDKITEGIELGSGGRLAETNYIFLALKNNSVIQLKLNNDSSIIADHQVAPAFILGKVYSLARAYEKNVDSLNKAMNARVFSGSDAERNKIKEEKLSQLRKNISDSLENFISGSTNANAAVLAYSMLEMLNKFELSTAKSAIAAIEGLNKNNKYLPAIKKKMADAEREEQFNSYRRLSLVSSICAVLFLAVAVVFYIQKKETQKRMDALIKSAAPKDVFSKLTRKEVEIFEMLAKGMSNKEIAAAQYLEISTIKKHISNIYTKTGIRNRAVAAQYLKKEP